MVGDDTRRLLHCSRQLAIRSAEARERMDRAAGSITRLQQGFERVLARSHERPPHAPVTRPHAAAACPECGTSAAVLVARAGADAFSCLRCSGTEAAEATFPLGAFDDGDGCVH